MSIRTYIDLRGGISRLSGKEKIALAEMASPKKKGVDVRPIMWEKDTGGDRTGFAIVKIDGIHVGVLQVDNYRNPRIARSGGASVGSMIKPDERLAKNLPALAGKSFSRIIDAKKAARNAAKGMSADDIVDLPAYMKNKK